MKKRKYYLAYGSNLNLDQMDWRCPGADPAGTATLEGWRLAFRGSGTGAYLTIEPCEGASVPMGVWRITESDERALDRYEGCPAFYEKRTVRVQMLDYKTDKVRAIDALIYVMRTDRPYGVPTATYVRTCALWYLDFGFDFEPLQAALDRSKKEVKSA